MNEQTLSSNINNKVNEYINYLEHYRYIFEVSKYSDTSYKELFVIYKSNTCKELYQNLGYHFQMDTINKVTISGHIIQKNNRKLIDVIPQLNIIPIETDPCIYDLTIS